LLRQNRSDYRRNARQQQSAPAPRYPTKSRTTSPAALGCSTLYRAKASIVSRKFCCQAKADAQPTIFGVCDKVS